MTHPAPFPPCAPGPAVILHTAHVVGFPARRRPATCPLASLHLGVLAIKVSAAFHGVFAPLEDVEFFKKVTVDPEIGTLVWPNGVDFCPDVLYSQATGKPLPELNLASAT